MKEAIIVCYLVILQMNVVAVTTGILTYIRYAKESLQCFILIYFSLLLIQWGLILKACVAFAGRQTHLFNSLIWIFDSLGTLGLLYTFLVFPFYIIGRKPGKWAKIIAVFMALIFVVNSNLLSGRENKAQIILNQAISAIMILLAAYLILSVLKNLANYTKLRAIGFLLALGRIFLPLVFIPRAGDGLILFQQGWFEKPWSLPIFLFLINCGGLLLIKTYFAVPFYVNPESGKLSEYFIFQFNITGREAEIIMLLRQGKAYKEIAAELTIAYKTVDAHIQNIYSKTGVNNKKQLINLIESSAL